MAYNQYNYQQQQQQQPPYGGQQQPYGQYQAPPPQQQGGAYQAPPPQQQGSVYGQHQTPAAAAAQQGYGGYQQPPPPSQAPPAATESNLRYWFDAVDTDRSGQLSVDELQRALINDNSGLINFAEFSGLWKYIEEWRACFSAFDQDKSGSIDFNELKTAMHSFRYNLSDDFLRLVIKKYDKRGKNPPGRGDVSFDMFIQISCTVKSLTDAFMRIDREGKGFATIGYEQFLELVVMNR
ncbi:hypothetical protein BGZ83_006052 [Gryganskiella cystojenkinii]|nr:hypothetical protein BGZ83_006052 [Gryganskiella cystojenkinii]